MNILPTQLKMPGQLKMLGQLKMPEMKVRALSAVLLGALTLGYSGHIEPALAADLGGSIKDERVYEPEPVRFAWTGFYVGLNAGADWQRDHVNLSPATTAAIPFFSAGAIPGRSQHHNHDASFIGGGQAGYNWQSGALIYGIELDYSGIDSRGNSTTVLTNAPGFVPFSTRTSSQVDQLGTLRARLGYAVAPRTMLYVTGGLAFGNTNLSSSITTPGTPCNGAGLCASGSSSDYRAGWALGGGIEHALTRNWSIKGEYLHYDLGSTSFRTNDPTSPGIVFQTNGKFEGDIARLGVNYRF